MMEAREALKSYHLSWLSDHPDRNEAWLRRMMAEGFHIHHIDGDHSNDDPANLVLIEGSDHLLLHNGKKRPVTVLARQSSSRVASLARQEQRKRERRLLHNPPGLDKSNSRTELLRRAVERANIRTK